MKEMIQNAVDAIRAVAGARPSVGLILGAASGISVMMSALLHNSSTILVVANSLRLMFMKPRDGRI